LCSSTVSYTSKIEKMKKLIALIYIAAATILFGYAKAEEVKQAPVTIIATQHSSEIFEELSVKIINNKAEISWSTANEHNNKQFEIQRSSRGEAFKTIAIFFTLEDSFKTKDYNFKDELKGVSGGKLSYRIKQVDLNNKCAYSKVIDVKI
jgi:hypothetical protein